MLYAVVDGLRRRAEPRLVAQCPSCEGPLIAKCGPIVTWHWAHRANDCDPWAEPESEWHREWKSVAEGQWGARVEVVARTGASVHRADIVLDSFRVVIELQHGYLSVADIEARESFWASAGYRLVWVYDARRFRDRLHFGHRGFWWKHGAKSMAAHRAPIWWDMGDRLSRVRVGVALNEMGRRVLGRVVETCEPARLPWAVAP